MTPLQLSVLDHIREQITTVGIAPSGAEMARKFDRSEPAIHQIVKVLIAAGALTRTRFKHRSLALPGAPDLRVVDTDALRGELARRGLTRDALATPRPLRNSGRACAAECCDERVPMGRLFCRRHWYKLPVKLRDTILRAHFGRDEDGYTEAVREAIDLLDTCSPIRFDGRAA